MKILVLEILEKGQILKPFSGLAPSKLEIFSKKLMVAYAHIEYSTYQFLRYRKIVVLRGLMRWLLKEKRINEPKKLGMDWISSLFEYPASQDIRNHGLDIELYGIS